MSGNSVQHWRAAFLWPLVLDPDRSGDGGVDIAALAASEAARLPKAWVEATDMLAHLGSGGDAAARAYAEFTYFHDFVQSFLFAKPDGRAKERRPVRLFKRTDFTKVKASVNGIESELDVDRLALYFFSTGVAILVLEVSLREICLPRALDLGNCLRRAHAPFLWDGNSPPGDQVPTRWTWVKGTDEISFDIASDTIDLPQTLLKAKGGRREVPPFRHWSSLLKDGEDKGWTVAPLASEGTTWRHMADDRLPAVVTLELKNPSHFRSISEGDWARICFLDGRGDSAWSYQSAFVKERWHENVYDRFAYSPDDSSFDPIRYLVTDYSLVTAGSGWFFTNHVKEHMRRHYFQLMLLAQFERAALLAFSSRITAAVEAAERGGGEHELRRRFDRIERDFLQFVNRFRFTGVSSQLQAREINDLLRARINLPALFEDLKSEIAATSGYLARKAEEDQARQVAVLTQVAALGLVPSLAFSFLGMNILTGGEFFSPVTWGGQWAAVLGTVGAFSLAGALIVSLIAGGPTRKLGLAMFIAGLVFVLFAVAVFFGH